MVLFDMLLDPFRLEYETVFPSGSAALMCEKAVPFPATVPFLLRLRRE
jgi:hypothetical protein